MASKRGNGEGSIYQRSDNGRWIAVMFVESQSGDGPRRKYISGNTRNDVVRQLKILQRQVDDGEVIHDSSITVEQLLVHWYQDVLKHQVTVNTADNYMTIATHHIIPTLGKTKIVKLTTNEVDRLLSKKSAVNGQLKVPAGGHEKSPPLERELLLL